MIFVFSIFVVTNHGFLNSNQKQIQLKSFQTPILVIGTKADMVDDNERIKELNRSGNIGTFNTIFFDQ